jgi:PAS domain S-box-containing protein
MEIHKPDWLAQMEGILEVLNEGVLVIDDCPYFIYANQRMVEMLDRPAEEFLGRGLDHFYQGDDLAFILRQREQGQRVGHNRTEFFVPRRDGSRLPVVFSARVLEDLEGREYTILTLTDISEQKRIEQQLRDANAQLGERQREIDFELSLAARVQQSLAPPSLRWGRAQVETAYLPVRSIGGDFGLVVPDGDDSLTVMVCDVSGHGISSALIANRIYTEAVSLLDRKTGLAEMLRRLNAFVLQHIRTTGFYFSMAAARWEEGGRRLTYAGAGHPPALHLGAQDCVQLMPRSAALGLLEDAVPEEAEEVLEFRPGDRMVLYTDGITESFDHREEQFGLARLRQALLDYRHAPLPDVKAAILNRVEAWRNGPASDDSSLVLVEIS